MLTLDSDRLHVEIAEPMDLSGQTRFDHTAFITQVILDGTYRFCGVEPPGVGGADSGGQGLCSEFQLLEPSGSTGGYILKPGVGLLETQSDAPFDPFYPYPYVPISVQVTKGNAFLKFLAEPVGRCDYGILVCRTVTVTGNTVDLETVATNTGKRPLAFHEYCHNFFDVGNDAKSACCLELPDVQGLDDCIRGNDRAAQTYRSEGDRIRLVERMKKPARFLVDSERISGRDGFIWRLTLGERSIEERTSFKPAKVVVWSKGEVLCPEVFCQGNLKSGESLSWKRTWSFG